MKKEKIIVQTGLAAKIKRDIVEIGYSGVKLENPDHRLTLHVKLRRNLQTQLKAEPLQHSLHYSSSVNLFL